MEGGDKTLGKEIGKAVTKHVAGKEVSDFTYMNSVLLPSLLTGSAVMLGDMPEPLLRTMIGNRLTLTRL
jgi:hypothetical protein